MKKFYKDIRYNTVGFEKLSHTYKSQFSYLLVSLLIYICLTSHICTAQNKKIDSLLTLIKTDAADTNKVIHLYKVCSEYRKIGEYNKGLDFGKQALELAQNIKFKKGGAQSYNNMGIIYDYQGNYPEALRMNFASLKLREEIKDKYGIAVSYNNIGLVYWEQGKLPEALKNHLASLKIREEINIDNPKDNRNKQGIATSCNNIGIIYADQNNYTEALKSYLASLKIFEEIKDNYNIAACYNNIGNIYKGKKNYLEALKNYFISLKIRQEVGNKDGMASSIINIGTLYIKLNKVKEAKEYLNRGLKLSLDIGSKDELKRSYAGLAVLDSITGNFKAAFEHHKLFIIYRDSLDNEETKKKSMQASMQYEFDKKEIAAKAAQDLRDKIQEEEAKKQKLFLVLVSCILVLVAVFAVFMFNRFRITQRQKVIIEKQKQMVDKAFDELHEKNKEVMDSIRYAKRIQTALITSEKYITNSLNRLIKNN